LKARPGAPPPGAGSRICTGRATPSTGAFPGRKGFEAGVHAVENKRHGDEDFHNTDGTPSWHAIAVWCQRHDDRLRDNERQFINNVAARTVYREPTAKEEKWLRSIFLRLGGKMS
jgi:hypothetical protein